MDCVLSGSLLVVFSLFCYAVCFLEQINSLSLSFSLNRSCTWEYDNVSASAVLSDDLHDKKWSALATQEARKKLLSGRQHTSM